MVDLPSNLKVLPNRCFWFCPIEKLIIPYGTENINGSIGILSEISIPSTVQNIDVYTIPGILDCGKIYLKKGSFIDKQIHEQKDYEVDESKIIYDDTVDFQSIKFLDEKMTIDNIGDKQGINYVLSPSTIDDSLISWSAEDSSIASVNQNGIVTARKNGTTNVLAKIIVLGEEKVYKYQVTVGETSHQIPTTQQESTTKIQEPTTVELTTKEHTTYDNTMNLSTPSGLAAVEDSEYNCQLYWQNVNDATLYNIYLNGKWISSTLSVTFKIPSQYFVTNGDYIIEVSALNGTGESEKARIKYVSSIKHNETTSKKVTTNNTTKVEVTTSVNKKPKRVLLKKITNIKGRKVKIFWKKLSGVSKYEIQYATNKKFTKSLKKTTAKSRASSKIIKSLKKNKYYFRIRAYKVVNRTKIYGSWSSVKKVSVK